MTADDLRLLHGWLRRDHVKRWWRVRETYEQVVEHYLPALEGREPTDHYLIVLDGTPIGSAFEKAGFRHVRDVEEDGLPHRLMRLDRG